MEAQTNIFSKQKNEKKKKLFLGFMVVSSSSAMQVQRRL